MTRPNRIDNAGREDVYTGRGGASSLASPQLSSPRVLGRRAFTLVWLTQLLPGSAQLVGGRRRVGKVALRILVALAAVLVVTGVLFVVNRAFVLNVLARPWVLLTVAVVLLALALGWVYLFIDTLRLANLSRLRPLARTGVAALAVVLMTVSAGTLTWGANALRIGAETVSAVFGGTTVRSPSDGRYNILLLGGDSGANREGLRPDTIMLASVEADTGKTVLFGFARDTENIDFAPGSTMREIMPEGWNCGDQCLLNGLYTWAHQNADQFPAGTNDPGVLATAEAVEWLSGLDVSYYAMVDMRGFQRFIDAVGGIQVTVGKPTPIGGGTSPIKGYIEPGRQLLDGYHALWYARSREGSTNYERMQRQQCVVTAMLHQLDPATVIAEYEDIAGAAGSTLVTDAPPADVGTLADLAVQARGHKTKAVNFTPPLIEPWDYEVEEIRTVVDDTLAASEADDRAPEFAEEPERAQAPERTAEEPSAQDDPETGGEGGDNDAPATPSAGGPAAETAGTGDLAAVCSAGWQ